jgi:hypothetical protein
MSTSPVQRAVMTKVSPRPAPAFRAVDFGELRTLELPERNPMLGAWLMEQSLNLLYGWRGIGKSHFSFGVAWAVATGGRFLSWEASFPRNVLFVDGELPARTVQERFAQLERSTDTKPDHGRLTIITPDLLSRAAPDIASLDDQLELDRLIEDCGAELIILDNLSCLVRSGAAENDAESWVDVSSWGLLHRAAGRSMLFVHHAGKGGAQRGTSRREDLLDVVIALKKPADYDPGDGARFEVHFEKARHLHGPEVEPFEAHLATDAGGVQTWATRSLQTSIDDRIVELHGLGDLSMGDIARELGVDKSTVSRHIKTLRDQGRLLEPNGKAPAKPKAGGFGF